MTTHFETPINLTGGWPQSLVLAATTLFAVLTVAVAGQNVLDLMSFDNFHEEVRVLHHSDPARVNAKDYSGQYLSKAPRPILYEFGTKLALGAGMDLVLFHKLISLACIVLLLAGGAVIGWRVAGAVGATAVTALIALQPIYQFQVNSAVPHAWGFPLLAWGLVFLLYGRPYALAALTILSGLAYPAVAPILGLALGWQLIIARKAMGIQNPNRIADIFVLCITGVISLLLLANMFQTIEGYGAPIAIGTLIDKYPENGADGRHFFGVFKPLTYVVASFFGQFRQELGPSFIAFLMLSYLGISGYGAYRLYRNPSTFQALIGFILPSIIVCVGVIVWRPYMSYRFVLYPLLAILPAMFVCGSIVLSNKIRGNPAVPGIAFIIVMTVYAVSLNGLDTDRNGFKRRLDEPSNKLIDFADRLPGDSLLAAWPDGLQTDMIPYLTGKPLFVTFKAHYPSHVDYVLSMRARMNDLIDAYLATDKQPLIKLRCKWGVDYMVVDREHFFGKDTAPKYFAPFDARIEKLLSRVDRSKLIMAMPPADTVVFQAGPFTIVDLSALSDEEACPQ